MELLEPMEGAGVVQPPRRLAGSVRANSALSTSVDTGAVVYDVSEWPVVQTTLPRQALSIADYQIHLERLGAELYSRGEPCLLLLDVRHHPPLTAVQRRLTAAFARENEVAHPGLLLGVALVSSSPVVRGAFTAVAWLITTPYPRRAFATAEAAKAWLLEL